jgi:hypothetical protein
VHFPARRPRHPRTWEAYRSFDRQEDAESTATFPELVHRVLEAQPESFYRRVVTAYVRLVAIFPDVG